MDNEKQNLWNQFFATGKINDYLAFTQKKETNNEDNNQQKEDKNKRDSNQNNQYK